ncbi:Preprotein translocase subunit YajC [Liberibacter crescens BT-1]|uniref:Sec translocon accessory complex subunit YajC n=1 Tax=Liberibacter crescens (strain BT-1) TaxID=1215343 RepID=L0ESY2_LIBCB|nr:Preprotein translocase subunit YajC [Liberibacter crescens BT-1]
MVVPLMLVWYFLLIRPQRQQIKQRAEMLKSIRRGDYVITGGGIAAKVTKVIDDTEIEVEIAEGIRVRVIRSFISDIRSKTEPVK